jgi:VanZ family protein
LFGLAYGIGMEFVQKYFISNRGFEIKDMIADGIGCFIGVFFSLIKYIKK